MAEERGDQTLTVHVFDLWQRLVAIPFIAGSLWLLYSAATDTGSDTGIVLVKVLVGAVFLVVFGQTYMKGGYTFDAAKRKVIRWRGTGVHVPVATWDFNQVHAVLVIDRSKQNKRLRFPFQVALAVGQSKVPLKMVKDADKAQVLAQRVAGFIGVPTRSE